MKVAVQVTEMKKCEDVKRELEGDFVMVTCLRDEWGGFHVGEVTFGESVNTKDVLKEIGEHIADITEKLSDNREEMVALAGELYSSVATRVMMKYYGMEGKDENK